MAGPEFEPSHQASPRLEPLVTGDSVPSEWLTGHENTEEAQRLERLIADQDLLTTLALNGYQGRDYEIFAVELAKYGMAVIRSWIRTRQVFAKCRERGFGGLPSPADDALRDVDTIDELTGETVAKALQHFRTDVLLQNRWVSSGGASLKTYFIGQCLIQFPNIYRSWYSQERRHERPIAPDEALLLNDFLVPGPESKVIDLQEIERGLAHVTDDRLREVVVLTAAGFSQREIGERLGITEKTVERMIANYRNRLTKLGIA